MKLIGDYHIHSAYSRDAKMQGSIDEIAKTAKDRGLAEIAITDHGPAVWVGAKTKHYPHIKAMCEKAEQDHGIRVFFGIEANITGDNGETDIPERFRKDLDIVVCGFHPRSRPANIKSLFTLFWPNYIFMFTWLFFKYYPKKRRRKNTEAIKRVIEKNNIDILAHPSRYFKVDIVEVAKTCAEHGTLIELNGKGISFRPIDFERCLAVGAKFIIGSDAHKLNYIGRTERVGEFLKNCDFKEEDIINLSGLFRRPEINRLLKISEDTHEAEEVEVAIDKKQAKIDAREKKKRDKILKSKATD
ncbi:MAG: PHP domain-containing protein [Firmicutes bacterium]|nr:PHP domain-containing protein [Bacillota bacterium]